MYKKILVLIFNASNEKFKRKMKLEVIQKFDNKQDLGIRILLTTFCVVLKQK
jgi:hypothetical protein